jgi:HSP20 family protein
MATNALSRVDPTHGLLNDFFKPWTEWFNSSGFPGRVNTFPAVNISEGADRYLVSLAAPGLKKEDFRIDADDSLITISAEKEEKSTGNGNGDGNSDGNEKLTRVEYSYSSFSRSFRLPEDVQADKIEARYEEGVLKIVLPRKTISAKDAASKKIQVK